MRTALIINGIVIEPSETYYAQERYFGIEGKVIGVEGQKLIMGPASVVDLRQMLSVCMPYGSSEFIEEVEVARYEISLQRLEYFTKK